MGQARSTGKAVSGAAGRHPLVSVIIASFNAADYLGEAICSALHQTLSDIEIIIADDASVDESVALANRFAADDPRVRVVQLAANAGPAAARNAAIGQARGKWIAVLDSDDRFHPDRLRALILQAETDGADIVADDLMVFQAEDGSRCHRFLRGWYPSPCRITLDAYLDATVMFRRHPDLGYLKPVVRADRLLAIGGYDERLRVGEDDDLIVRLLLDGARYRLVPSPTYFYRKHEESISHRLDAHHLRAMIARAETQLSTARDLTPGVRRQLARRIRARRRALNFVLLVGTLKRGDTRASITAALARPSPVFLLRLPLMARLERGWGGLCRRSARLVVRKAPRLPARLPGAQRPIRYHAPATAAGMLGLTWLLDNVWPIVVRTIPDPILIVSGTVTRHLPAEGLRGIVSDSSDSSPPGGAILAMPDQIATLNASTPCPCAPPGSIIVATSVARLPAGAAGNHIIADDAELFAAALIALISNTRPHPDSPPPSGERRDPEVDRDKHREKNATHG